MVQAGESLFPVGVGIDREAFRFKRNRDRSQDVSIIVDKSNCCCYTVPGILAEKQFNT